jgi:hypothetical protein
MFVLMLYEPESRRKVPVMIGSHEAEMLLLELSGKQALRPMTHQLITSIMEQFALTLKLVRIERFEEGIFYATLDISDGFNIQHIDARASDAILLAMRQGADIEMAQNVLDDTGFTPKEKRPEEGNGNAFSSVEELEKQLCQCEENEDYERAAEIMEKIKRLKGED